MTIKGSLETFSLPELFHMIDSGSKSGRLTFKSEAQTANESLAVTYELWFDKGNFVTISNSLKQQFLTSRMINMGWIDIKVLIDKKLSCPANQAICQYLLAQNMLSQWQIDTLFLAQKREVIKLFKKDRAWFEFEELEDSNGILSDKTGFPWEEMTGEQSQARELSLEAMRKFPPKSSRFLDEMPPIHSGLKRLINHCNLQFDTLEKYLCNMADGSISLRKIAQEMEVSIDKVQTTALSMILAGLVEEVPIASPNFNLSASETYNSSSALNEQKNQPAKTKGKSKVSNSLLKNLTSFLRNNF